MCILEIERTLNNVVACLALPGTYPQSQNRRASSVLSSNAHACNITRLTSIFYAIIFRTGVKTFDSISYTNFSLDGQQLFTQLSLVLVSIHSPVYHIRISPSQNCRFFSFFTVDFLSLRRCKTSDNDHLHSRKRHTFRRSCLFIAS
jgi:hypothetical protein